ncbi:hypothetical protein OG738_40155 [Amycolatopsis sp. NBC_01488]|uniref:hypothetical protein n=1 Tax=Amycolatopsis sp. NBC_01488 TaxID=2903563 RepID=UPI002E28D3A1|nr:hypothetical protein [Amycolatopsis sp. NBC_01488]
MTRRVDAARPAKRIARARLVWAGGVLLGSRVLPVPRKVALVLAARHLVQGAAALRRPDGVVARWGWTADVAHSLSMVGLAALSRRWRAAALANAVVAAGWARAARIRTGERR